MTDAVRGERPRFEKPPGSGPRTPLLRQDEADRDSLRALADERGYVAREDGTFHWLEWSTESKAPQSDLDATEAHELFCDFKPFEYPPIEGHSDSFQTTLSVEWPTFLPHVARGVLSPYGKRGRTAGHVRELAGRLKLDKDGRALPHKLDWLAAYRDALSLDLRRCAARLGSPPDRTGTSPLDGARATLKVWLIETAARGVTGPGESTHPLHVARETWERFTRGGTGSDDRLALARLLARFARAGADRALSVATVAGLRHHGSVRDVITAPGADIWFRLLAAETVLHAAIVGTPLDEAWVEAAVRQQEENEERERQRAAEIAAAEQSRAELGRTLADAETKWEYVRTVLMPAAGADRKARSFWEDVYRLFLADWARSGLAIRQPHATWEHLKKAMQAANRRARERARGDKTTTA
ncbi:MAG TPA: hypothetical protein VGB53_16965 [Rubricoccaceae bacterium]